MLNKTFLLLISTFLFSVATYAQSEESELALLEKKEFVKPEYNPKVVHFMLTKSKNPVIRYNPVSLSFGGLMFFYQKILSPQFSTNCSYEISCSSYSIKAIQRYGIIKGIPLTADRLMRCTQFSAIDIHQLDVDMKKHKVRDSPEKYTFKK